MRHGLSDFPAASEMSPVSLGEMKSVSLMNRTDTKYVTGTDSLKAIMDDALAAGYRICEISGERMLDYSSVYYDTQDLKMFTMHRNGKKRRQKVRVRTYLIDNVNFLEIKNKDNHGRTKKKRIEIPAEAEGDFTRSKSAVRFLEKESWWKASCISPETATDFSRMTLVNRDMTERLTIDTNLRFRNFRSGISAETGNLVIIELKQDGRTSSQMKEILLRHRVFPYRISKYCIAVALTDPSARPGRFLLKIRYIEKITNLKLIKNEVFANRPGYGSELVS